MKRHHHLLTPEEISKLAYEMYLVEGRPEGRALDHWLSAERTLVERKSHEQSRGEPTAIQTVASGLATLKQSKPAAKPQKASART